MAKVYNLAGSDCLRWFQNVLDELPNDGHTFCIAICWLWWEHNQITHGSAVTPMNRILDFWNRDVDGVALETLHHDLRWKPPEAEFLKLNVDAAVPADCNR